MTRYYTAVRVPGTQAPAMILAGWNPPERYTVDRYPVWLHRFSATAAEAIAACAEEPVCLVEKRPGGSLIWPRGDELDAAAVAAMHDGD